MYIPFEEYEYQKHTVIKKKRNLLATLHLSEPLLRIH